MFVFMEKLECISSVFFFFKHDFSDANSDIN